MGENNTDTISDKYLYHPSNSFSPFKLTVFRTQARLGPLKDALLTELQRRSRHSHHFKPFFQILVELTRLYGRSDFEMNKLYRSLRRKSFPHLGQSIQLSIKKKGRKLLFGTGGRSSRVV